MENTKKTTTRKATTKKAEVKKEIVPEMTEQEILDSVVFANEDNVVEEVVETKTNYDEPVIKTGSNDEVEDLLNMITASNDELEVSTMAEEEHYDYKSEEIIIGNDEMIPCKSNVFGGLNYTSQKTGAKFSWDELNSVESMPYYELIAMNNDRRQYLNTPLLIVQDARVVKKLHLLPVYEKMAKIANIPALVREGYDAVDKALDFVIDMDMERIFISKARKMIEEGILTDYRIIKLIEKRTNFVLLNDKE